MPEDIPPADYAGQIRAILINGKPKELPFPVAKYLLSKGNYITTFDDRMYKYDGGVYTQRGLVELGSIGWNAISELTNGREMGLGKYTNPIKSQIIGHIQDGTYKYTQDIVQADIELVCLENGILNIKTKELSGYTPDKIFFSKLPIKYDPKATCDTFDQFLKDVLPHTNQEKYIATVEELFGYLLYRHYNINAAFMFLGSGRNGKGTLLNVMKAFVGQDNATSMPLQDICDKQFAVCELFGKIANISNEISHKRMEETGKFKQLTSYDPVTVDVKHKGRIQFRSYAKLIFACNELPQTPDKSDAYYRRWVKITFQRKFDKGVEGTDVNMIDKLTTPKELSGILNKALIGLSRLLEKGDFSYSEPIEETRNSWERDSDPVSAFILDCIYVDHVGTSGWMSKNDVFKGYLSYCEKLNMVPVSDKKFYMDFNGFFERGKLSNLESRHGDIKGWRGISIREDCIITPKTEEQLKLDQAEETHRKQMEEEDEKRLDIW